MCKQVSVLHLKKTRKKPYATGIYFDQSVGTRACIFQNYTDEWPTNDYFVSVWEQRNSWYDGTESRYIKLHSISECRKWLTENCGGTWITDRRYQP